MRIGILLPHGFFPADNRAVKEVRVLVAGGHDVSILCRAYPGEARSEEVMGARVERMTHSPGIDRLANLLLKMAGYRWHPIWDRRIHKFIKNNGIEAIHTHDLRPALIGCKSARRSGLPVVVDLHEDYATQNAAAVRTFSARAFNSIRKIDRVEGRVMRMADRVLVTSQLFLDIVSERYGIPPDKMLVIPNYQDLDSLVEPEDMEPIGLDPEMFTVTFVGTVGSPARGVQMAIEAWPYVLDLIPEARLVIVGDGGYLPAVKDVARRLGVLDSVVFTGWVDHEDCAGYILAADVCIITLLSGIVQSDITSPHKLFQYMAARKPVLVSDSKETSKIVTENRTGLVYRSRDPKDFACKLAAMRDPATRDAMGERGYRAVRDRYNFESLSGPLLGIYDEIDRESRTVSGGRPRGG